LFSSVLDDFRSIMRSRIGQIFFRDDFDLEIVISDSRLGWDVGSGHVEERETLLLRLRLGRRKECELCRA
jgi:hypothetical protein